jgi:hypothetical protein
VSDWLADLAVAIFTAVGWLGVAYIVLALPVSAGAQAAFYTAGFVALAGTAALVIAGYGARVSRTPARGRAIDHLGTGMRFAVAMEFALWLQSLRMLTPIYVLFILVGFSFLEMVFRRARSYRGE